MKVALHDRKHQREDEEGTGGVFCNLGQHRAGSGAEEGIGGAAAEGQAGAGILFRELNQD